MSKPELTYARPLSWGELEELQREYQSQIMYLANGDYHPKAREGKSILVDLQDLELDQAELSEDGITSEAW